MKNLIVTAVFTVVFTAVATSATHAQKLRRAVAAADLVVLAKVVRVIPTKTHVIHRLRIDEVLRGPTGFDKSKQVAILETKRVSAHNKPVAGKSMLLCLHDHDQIAKRAGLPKSFGPGHYKMSGHPGSAVELDNPAKDSRLAFARILIASQLGQSSRKTTEQVFALALRGDKSVRTEASLTLSERPALSACLTSIHLDKLLARAVAESVDIRYKISLASICAGRKLESLVPALCRSAEQVGDEGYLRAIGRFARYIHRDKAHEVVLGSVRMAKGRTRERLIVALGATSTEGALETLLEMRKRGKDKLAVEAALLIHGSPLSHRGRRKETDYGEEIALEQP